MGTKAKLASLGLALALTGCEKTQWTRDEIANIAEDVAPEDTSSRVAALEARVTEMEDKLGYQEKLAGAISSDLSATQKALQTANKTADINSARDMTRRGACGQEWAVSNTGQSYLRNKRCTVADLSPD